LKKSSTPPASGGMALGPSGASSGSWPVNFAWAAALGEFVCGAALLVGLFTRVSAVGILSIMLGAMWLTELGPAIQAGKTFLYLVPSREAGEFFSVPVWQRWFWQVSLICSGIALAMLGPGPLSLDHGVFGSGDAGPAPKPAPKPEV
ncbi:MAG: DoxX family protein, partial [Phycisphaerales bacterium]|nr:DoxX family protein [Phycisphaerales bacterium]